MILPRSLALRQTLLLAIGFALACFGESLAQIGPVTGASAIGEWTSHIALQEGRDVTSCGAFDAYVAGGSVVLRYRDSGEIRKLDKVNALSQANAVVVACNPFVEGQLLVGYEDGAVDVVEDERVTYYANDIAEATILGNRALTAIAFASSDEAIICLEFGYLVFDPNRGVFIESVEMGTGVNDAAALDGDLYLATARGLEVVPDYQRQPLLRDTSVYVSLGSLVGGANAATALETWRGEVYVGVQQALYAVDAGFGESRLVDSFPCFTPADLAADDETLAMAGFNLRELCGPPRIDRAFVTQDGRDFRTIDTDCSTFGVLGVAPRDGGVAWAGQSFELGFCRTPSLDADCTCVNINSPNSNDVYDIDVRHGVVAVVSGSVSEQAQYTFNGGGAYVLRDGRWSNYNERNNAAFRDDTGQRLLDMNAVALGPDTTLYAGAYFEGVAVVTPSGATETYNERNSSLGTALGDPERVRIGGLDFDAEENLWVANPSAGQPLSVRTANDVWMSFSAACGRDGYLSLDVDERTGIVWMRDFETGVVAYSTSRTLLDASDDQCRSFRPGGSDDAGLPSNDIRDVHVDRDGVVWAATGDGIARLTCSGDPFAPNCDFTRPTAVVDGINGFLFDDQLVRAITSDGANRKWVGTANGLFLLDEGASEQLAVFTESNSPLLNNTITTLAFDDLTGQLWVGTAGGLLSLQTESTGGEEFTHSDIEIYPQPVRPDYDGPIAIRGLAQDSNVKITDAAGRLVFETDALGGQAVWDGRDYTGARPASGVYLVWATADRSFDKPATVVAKIALLR